MDRIQDIINKQSDDGIKLAVGNVYNQCRDEQKRMMYSFVEDYPTVDVMICIDGPYKFLTEDNVYGIKVDNESTDGTNEMIDTFIEEQNERGSRGIKVYRETCISDEFGKRQRYLELVKLFKCNVLLIVDSDEYVTEDPRIQITKDWYAFRQRLKSAMKEDHNVYDIDIAHTEFGGREPHKRIWLRPDQMSYFKGSHYKYGRIKEPNEDQAEWLLHHNSQPSWYCFKDITLKHDHNLRTDWHLYHRKIYENYLVNYEMMLESGYSMVESDIIAKIKMTKTVFPDRCTCHRCIVKQNIDPRILFDARPKVMRKDFDPFADIKQKMIQDPAFAKSLKLKFE